MKRGRNQRRRQGMNVNRALDSNGPDVRIRGTANQIYDKYQALARDAASSGDRVKAENYLQHAEHYFRLIRSMQPAQQPQAPQRDAADGEGDQPALGEGVERRRRRESAEDSQPAAPEAAADEAKAGRTNGAAEGEAEASAEEPKPRRRRQRRTTKKEDADEKPAEATAN